MAEHQTTGGYSRIGSVIAADIPRLAQSQPGTKIRFKEISLQTAQDLLMDSKRRLNSLYKLSSRMLRNNMNLNSVLIDFMV